MSTFDKIKEHFGNGGSVMVATYLKATIYKPKHADMFSAPTNPKEDGVYVRRGKRIEYVLPQYLRFSVIR